MAKTVLFRELRRSLSVASWLERRQIPTERFLESLAQHRKVATEQPGVAKATPANGFSRRRFLQGAAVASLATAWRATPLRASSESEVVIVGAGIAGLTCAYRLQARGIRARVVEASTRVGGRMFSLRNTFPDGQLTELGGELIDSDHTSLLGLARELGLEVVDLAYVDTNQGNSFHFGGKLYAHDNHLLDVFRPLAAKILADVGEEGENLAVDHRGGPEAGVALDRLSLEEWLTSREIDRLGADIIRVAYRGEYGLEPEDQSSLNLLSLVGTEAPPVEIYGSSDERFHLRDGNDLLPQALARRLERPIELGTQLEALRSRADGGYLLTLRCGEAVHEVSADHVVLALPFSVLRHLDLRVDLPAVKRRVIDELGYGTNAKLICGFSARPWTHAGASGAVFSDLGFQMCWETSRAQAGRHGILTNFLGGHAGASLHQGNHDEHARRFVGQIDKVFPGTATAFTGQAVRFSWPTHRFTQGSYTCYRPGQWSTLLGAEAFAVGGIHFCGEHTSSQYSGFMNGAAESGERVAHEVLAAL